MNEVKLNKDEDLLARINTTYIDKDGSVGVCVETARHNTWAKLRWISKVGNLKYGWMPMSVLKESKQNLCEEK